jgi:hypothetical protein
MPARELGRILPSLPSFQRSASDEDVQKPNFRGGFPALSKCPFRPFDPQKRPFTATRWRTTPITLKLYEVKDLFAVFLVNGYGRFKLGGRLLVCPNNRTSGIKIRGPR